MKRIIKKLFLATPKESKPPEKKYPADFDETIAALITRVKPYTMTSPESLYALYNAVKYIIHNNIPGDFVECGVWKGGSIMAMLHTLLELGVADRTVNLFDTFEGMTEPTQVDVDLHGVAAKDLMPGYDWVRVGIDQVRSNVRSLGYPDEKIKFIKGLVEETLPAQAPSQIALLRLDTDWYESTLHELECLFPKIAQGGVIIIDDYGHFQGAKKAVDEYLKKNNIKLLLHRVDYTVRTGVVL